MRLGQIRIELQRALGRRECIDVPAVTKPKLGLGERHQSPGFGVIGIDRNRLMANADRHLVPAAVADIAADPVLPRHQVEVVGIGTDRAALLDRLFLLRQQPQLQRIGDRLRNLVLDRENIGEVAVVALGPDMVAGRAVDQLRGDAHAGARLAHAAFEDVSDAELARRVLDVDLLALETERRVARDDRQRRNLRQIGDDVLADPVAEIFLLRISAHILERQHAD